MVITASEKHAVRVMQAVLGAVGSRPELVDFVIGDRPEPFAVTTIDQAVAQGRDRVIFSIGYGRTPRPGAVRLLEPSASPAVSGCSRSP